MAVGAAIGQACLLLAAGKKGRRFMMPHAKGTTAINFFISSFFWVFLCWPRRIFKLPKRPHLLCVAMIQQPRVPSSGQMPASDVLIRAKEVNVTILTGPIVHQLVDL